MLYRNGCVHVTCWRLVVWPGAQDEELSALGRGVVLYSRLGLEFEGGDGGQDGANKFLRLVFRQVRLVANFMRRFKALEPCTSLPGYITCHLAEFLIHNFSLTHEQALLKYAATPFTGRSRNFHSVLTI